jgi:hypothetical protein
LNPAHIIAPPAAEKQAASSSSQLVVVFTDNCSSSPIYNACFYIKYLCSDYFFSEVQMLN